MGPVRPARADTAYRYWAFYVAQGGSWQFSQRGPASEYPADGEVQGWRFAIQAEAAHGLPPRAAADFATLCAATPAAANEIRVGIVLDFGTTADEPAHERPPASVVPGCVRVHAGDSGAAVLEAAAQVRIGTGADEGIVCGLDGYPRSECAPAVTTPAAPSPSSRAAATTAVSATVANATTSAAPATSAALAPTSATTPMAALAASSAAPTVSAVAAASPDSAVAAGPTTLTAARAATPRARGFSVTTAIGIALVVALALGALWRSRGRRR